MLSRDLKLPKLNIASKGHKNDLSKFLIARNKDNAVPPPEDMGTLSRTIDSNLLSFRIRVCSLHVGM